MQVSSISNKILLRPNLFLLSLSLLFTSFFFLSSCTDSFEKSMIFHPKTYTPGPEWKAPEGGEDVWINTKDGKKLHGWFLTPEDKNKAVTVIYFHGNGGNITSYSWAATELRAQGYSVMIYDYRGYGRSEGSVPDEDILYSDADEVYQFIINKSQTDPKRIVFYGFSLGTAIATEMANRHRCMALVLECGMTSAKDMADIMLPSVSGIFDGARTFRLNSANKISGVNCPVLISHGDADDIIPVDQGKKLYELAKKPKHLAVYHGVGHNILSGAKEKYVPLLNEFIKNAQIGYLPDSGIKTMQ